jgi:hemoglobin
MGAVSTTLSDIQTRGDCELLVRDFYGRALEDDLIGFLFVEVAKLDLEQHVPKVTAFWETILLGAQTYTGGAFHPHATLNSKAQLRQAHFERWLVLWCRSVDEHFDGPRAAQAKVHAMRVANAFYGRLQTMTPVGPAPEAPLLSITQHGPGESGAQS